MKKKIASKKIDSCLKHLKAYNKKAFFLPPINEIVKKTIFIFIVPFLFLIGGLRAQTFKAAAAVRVITPDPLLPVSGGIGIPKPTNIKKGDLYTRVLVL